MKNVPPDKLRELAHELKNLFCVIQVHASICASKASLPEELRYSVDQILKAVEKGNNLAHSLLGVREGPTGEDVS